MSQTWAYKPLEIWGAPVSVDIQRSCPFCRIRFYCCSTPSGYNKNSFYNLLPTSALLELAAPVVFWPVRPNKVKGTNRIQFCFVKTFYKANVNTIFPVKPVAWIVLCLLLSFHESELDINTLTQCFLCQLFFFTLLRRGRPEKMEWPHFLKGSWQVNPSICQETVGFGWLALDIVSERHPDRCQARWDLWEASMKQSITFKTAIWLTAAPITQSSF